MTKTLKTPPELLSSPLNIPMDDGLIRDLNAFRQAVHFQNYPPVGYGPNHANVEREKANEAARSLAKWISDWVDHDRQTGPLLVDLSDLAARLEEVEQAQERWKALDAKSHQGELSATDEAERRRVTGICTLGAEQLLAEVCRRVRLAREAR